jgi:hypothetical protein
VTASGGNGGPDRLDAELLRYAATLCVACRTLLEPPYVELAGLLAGTREVTEAVGRRLARDAAWLRQRESYLRDAADRVADAAARLHIAVTAPLESDMSVRVGAARDTVEYFRDVVGDIVPAPAYRDISAGLLAALDHRPPAPALYLQVLPLVESVLTGMRRAGELAAELSRRATAVRAGPVPGFGRAQPARPASAAAAPAEIDRIVADLRARAHGLAGQDREDEVTYDRAVGDCFGLTPAQLHAVLKRYTPMRAGDGRPAPES